MTPLEQRERFYRAILSNTKYDIELRALPSKHRIFTRDQGAIEQFISQHITDNLYHGVYTREGGGSKDHVREVPCFFADLDFKNYENGEEEARSRLKAFEPYPSFVVYSGNGFHAYWFLDRIIEPSQKVEAILRGIAKHLRGDASAAELARILRIPGTVNYKNDPKKPVGLIHASDLIYPPELFDRYEEKAIIPDARNNGSKELSEHIETIRAKCTFLKYCYDKRASLPEPLWFLMVSNLSRYPVNPYDLVHAFSLEHPGYSPRETEQKIKHGINDTQPHTCAYIKETMKDLTGSDCGKDCRVTAPIVLLTRTRTAMKTSQASMILTRLNDLFNEPEDNVTWQVEGILPTGGFSVLASKPKTGKSTLARNLALCTAQGELFLSRGVQKGPVIYYALEEKRSEVRRHFQDMGATGEEEIHIYSGSAPIDAIMQIREATEQIRPVLIIIDPLFRLARVRDGNDYAAVTQALEPLLILARETGAHVLCVHHTGKGDRQGGDSVLGSTAIFSSVDTLLLMKRYEHYRTIHSIQRYGEDVEETTLHYNTEDRTIQLGESKEQEDIVIFEEAISRFLTSQKESVTEVVIMTSVEGRTAPKKKALRELVRKEQVIRTGKGGKKDPFKYSGFVVPNIYREPGNQNQINDVTPENNEINTGSHVWEGNSKEVISREPEKQGEIIDLEGAEILELGVQSINQIMKLSGGR